MKITMDHQVNDMMMMDTEISSDTVDNGAVRRSHRTRPLSQKAEENALQELKQAFWKQHSKFAINLNEVEIRLSGDCDDDTLETMQSDLKKGYREIETIYDEIKVMSIATPDQEIRLGIDRVKADKDLLVNAIQLKTMAEDKETRHSVSDRTKQTSRRSDMSSRHSNISDTSSKIRDAKANAAARKIEMSAQQEQLEREEELDEIQNILNRKKREIEHQRLSMLLRVEEAKLQVYEDTQRENMRRGVLGSGSQLYSSMTKKQEVQVSTPLHMINPETVERQSAPPKNDVSLIAEALAASVNANRLPVPEPSIFNGDPLEYPDWKASFYALVESRGIPSQEKIHHLKRYLGGPAREAVSGYFLLKSENAYDIAKDVLEQRYGSSFAITEAFRDKLDAWPRIQARDAKGLRRLSDFLNQCESAMTDIQGLEILNDNRENRKILCKLPDWIITRWSRIVSNAKKVRSSYPSFTEFANFIAEEADIACDPIVSLESLRIVPEKEKHGTSSNRSARAATFATETSKYDEKKETNQYCVFCRRNGHIINECRTFGDKPYQEKQEFVREKGLCFGCLQRGHFTKNCTSRSKCKKCDKCHPTCLHTDKTTMEYRTNSRDLPTNVEDTHIPDREAVCSKVSIIETESMSSMIVPVWVSSKENPNKEHLV